MNYGMLAPNSCLLTDIADQLYEPPRKINIIDRLFLHLTKSTYKEALKTYLTQVKKWCTDQPVSIFSKIHSSNEKNFTSINTVTFSVMDRGCAMFGKAVFVMDQGYDDNKMFLKLDSMNQDYLLHMKVQITVSRKDIYRVLVYGITEHSILKTVNPVKEKIQFCYYRLATGISDILSDEKEGIRLWFRTKRSSYRQLCQKLTA